MTPNELSARLRIMQEALQNPALRDRMAVAACNQISALVKRRVFRDGIAQDGGKIGSYSTKPAYFSTSIPGLPKVAPKGKAKRAKRPITAKRAIRVSGIKLAGSREKLT